MNKQYRLSFQCIHQVHKSTSLNFFQYYTKTHMLKSLVASPLLNGDLKCHIPRQCRSVCNMHMRISGFKSHLHVISHLHLHPRRFQEESLVIGNNSLFTLFISMTLK